MEKYNRNNSNNGFEPVEVEDPDQKATSKGEGKSSSTRFKIILVILVVVVVVIAIVIGVVLGSRRLTTYKASEEHTEGAIYLDSGESKQITSPGYPQPYQDDSRQYWIIIAPDDHRVQIDFTDLRTEEHYDSVRIGSSSKAEENFIAAYTGYDLPPLITSSGNALWVQLYSDESTTELGFNAVVTAVENKDVDSFTCPPNEHRCDYVFTCYSEQETCDGTLKCPTGADERGCGCINPFFFQCFDGRCLDRIKMCNNVSECSNDETNCGFECDNGNMISKEFLCDEVNDCGDYTDERDCECSGGELWQCNDGTCIYRNNVCDEFPHCPGGEDENDCTCTSWQFECGTGECIPYWERCDGNDTCGDNSDEQSCPVCPGRLYQCNSFQCLPADKVCDGKVDCYWEEDEAGCDNTTSTKAPCKDGEFTCSGGKCLRSSLICDDVEQCPKGEDEADCPQPTETTTCIECSSGECIPEEALCDGSNDCSNGEDEADCIEETPEPPSCSDGQYLCTSDESCIPETRVCNGIQDCLESEDEHACNETTDSCANFDNSAYFVCDGKPDCPNATDENCICGTKPALSARIYAGRAADMKGAWPWQVILSQEITPTEKVTCGGSIINRNWVLTAGHCLGRSAVGTIHVIAGVTDRKDLHDHIQTRIITKMFVHPNTSIGGYDITLIKMDEPFDYSALVQPVCLPESNLRLLPGTYVTVTGWGDTGGSRYPYKLMEARIPVIPPEICALWNGYHWKDRLICAGYERGVQSPCYGDSGGPLVWERNGRWLLVGAVSGGSKCGTPYTPGIYTRISNNIDWIESVIKNN